ncbi:MAG TPA: PQQ-dependent sugar dehydrogenase [Aggregicoccus sp.]|nr:PQQ-dependent sugar dehydrogenase [Aggregicoccus sp.]
MCPGRLGLLMLLLAASGCYKVKGALEAGTSARSELALPAKEPFSEALLSRLRVPPGFRVEVFAQGLEGPRILALAPDGSVLVSRPGQGDVLRLRDGDGDGRAEEVRPVLSGLKGVHGLAVHAGQLYLAAPGTLWAAPLGADGTPGAVRALVTDLPPGGQHDKPTLGVGPDGKLYLSVGSSCNVCAGEGDARALLLRFDLEGSGREVFARGLRNTLGFAWHPDTGALWGMDHGSDHRGNDLPPEELNELKAGRDYGWPYVFGARQPDLLFEPPEGQTREAYAERTEPMVLGYQAHSAPIQLLFHDGRGLPAQLRGDGFVTLHGSWNRDPPTGYKVVRLRFEQGRPARFEDVLTGVLSPDRKRQVGRPAGLLQLRDGSLLVGDDTNGVLYRVRYVGAPAGG